MEAKTRSSSRKLVRIAALVAALAAAAPAGATSGLTVADDFDDASLNAHLWRVAGGVGGASVAQTGGRLEIATKAGQDLSYAQVDSVVALTGDFDVTVGYEQVSLPTYWSDAALLLASCDGRANMNIYISRSVNDWNAFESTYYLDGVQRVPPNYWTFVGSDTTGKLRITRTGSTFSSYFWRGSAWQLLATAVVFDGPARITLNLVSNNLGTPGTAPSAIFRWDNLVATSRGGTGCPAQ